MPQPASLDTNTTDERDPFQDALHEAGLRDLIRRSLRDALRRVARRRLVVHVAPNVLPFRPNPVAHFHHRPELFLQIAGHGRMELSGEPIVFEPGELVVIPRGIAHDERIVDARRRYLNLVFAYSDHGVGCHSAGNGRHGRPRGFKGTHAPSTAAPRLTGYLDDLAVAAEEDGAHAAPLQRGLVEAHLALLARTFDLECSADHLSHRFHLETGNTLTAHINQRRVDLGCRLLETTTMNISEVAFACGYGDAGYFTRVFRRARGASPRAWRDRD
jgi:AraC-like DNA-binding protein